MNPNEAYAFNWLVKRGYQPHQAAGIVGNFVQESGVRPAGVVGDNGTAFGVAQWRGDRLAGLKSFAAAQGADWQNLDTQLAYADWELKNTEKRAGDLLRAATDVQGATRAMMGFERPQGFTWATPEAGHGWENRINAARRIAGLPAGSPAVASANPVAAAAVGARPAPVPAPVPAMGDLMATAATPATPSLGAVASAFLQQAMQQSQERKRAADEETARRRQALFDPRLSSLFA